MILECTIEYLHNETTVHTVLTVNNFPSKIASFQNSPSPFLSASFALASASCTDAERMRREKREERREERGERGGHLGQALQFYLAF